MHKMQRRGDEKDCDDGSPCTAFAAPKRVGEQDEQRARDHQRRADSTVHDRRVDLAGQHVVDDLDALPQVWPDHHRDVTHAEQERQDTGDKRDPAPM